SWIFPINLARYGKALGDDVNNAIMPFFLAGTAGAASTTFLIGSVSDLMNSLRRGLGLLAISAMMLLILQVIISKMLLHKNQPARQIE
ncbi:MAG TPA: hypothetical protein VNK26_05340, partial [Pyrinomonadaceae bacterium]|nr:hypothetical protein [Pyrinomonadaceae bacterium]